MFGQRPQPREIIENLARRFREKGATSPDKAVAAEDLDLHERFVDAMKNRLGQTGIFVNVGGKYYLNEARLKDFEQRQGNPS